MVRLLRRLKTVRDREEVPRSLGLLLVLAYVAGLAGIGFAARAHTQTLTREQAIETNERALFMLAGLVPAAAGRSEAATENLLQRFARSFACAEIRLYDPRGQVSASLAPVEVGQPLPPGTVALPLAPEGLCRVTATGATGEERLIARVAVSSSGRPPTEFLEAVFDLDLPAAGVPSAGTMSVVLACTAALLVIYRRLRRYYHSYARIADNLVQNANHLDRQLEELRLADAGDQVAACWNKLIDFALALEQEVARSTAATELLAVLSKSNGGELAEALTTVPVGVMLVTEDGAVAYANAMARRLVGWTAEAEDAPTLDDPEIGTDGRQIVEHVAGCLRRRGGQRPADRRFEFGDGSHYHVQVVGVRTAQQVRRLVVLLMDVSQQVRADKAREEFVSQVTHELRTPLTNIRAYAETLSSGMFDDPQVITECYNVITKETRRLGRLIEDILSISQLEVGTMQLVVDDVDLRPLLTEAVRDVRGLAEAKNIDLQTVLPPKLDPIRADRDKLAVVMNNLLGNAIKYTPPGGQVVLTGKAEDGAVLISVRDTGIGIDPKDHHRIFEKFHRADDEAVRAETGTGIGLTTAREIVQQHGGEITLVSRKGEGSTFSVRLPVEKHAEALVEAGV